MVCLKWKDKLDPVLTKIAIYVIATISILYLMYKAGNSIYALLLMVLNVLGSILHIFIPVFWGFFLAYLLMPLTNFLQKKMAFMKYSKSEKTYRAPAVILTIIMLVVFIIGFLSILITTFTSQAQIADLDSTMAFFRGVASNLQSFYRSLINELSDVDFASAQIQEYVDGLVVYFTDWINGFGKNMFSSIEDIPNLFSQLFLSIIFAMWFLLDGAKIAMYLGKVMYAILPDNVREKIADLIEDTDEVFSGYIRGQVLDAILMMIMISITLSLCKVKFAVAIGILAGLGNLIPYVGPFIAYAGTIAVCLLNGEFYKMIYSLIFLWIIQSIDGNIINPRLLGKQINIHPMYVIISILIGSEVGGLLGMLFAVPIAALLKKQFDRVLKKRIANKQQKEIHQLEKKQQEENN